jgi:SulP family sulfate permease
MIALSWIFDFAAHDVSILGPVPSGLPHIGLPQGVSWSEAGGLLGTAGAMFLVILAQSAATSRAFGVKYSERTDENTDLVGLGLANLTAGISSTFVVNGSPTKTEMVDEAKSHTQVAQLTTAVVVGVVLVFLTKPLQYLPNAVLASVVFLIGVKLIDVKGMREILRLRSDEFVVALVTAVVVVIIGVEQGILLAIVLSILLHVRRSYEPVDGVLIEQENGQLVPEAPIPGVVTEPGLVIYLFGASLFYANASRFTDEVLALVATDPPPRWFVLDAPAINDIDFTGGKTLGELVDQLRERDIVFALAHVTERARRELDRYGLTAKIGEEYIFENARGAIDAFRKSR